MQSNASYDRVSEFLLDSLKEFQQRQEIPEDSILDHDTLLMGDGGVIDSRSLVELLIGLEEFLEEQFSADFNWTTDRAMSAKRSPFRTLKSLAEFAVSEAGL